MLGGMRTKAYTASRNCSRIASRNPRNPLRPVSAPLRALAAPNAGLSGVVVEVPAPPADPLPPISITSKALERLKLLRAETSAGGDEMILRIGVKQGGCSGMSYKMDFEKACGVSEDDHVMVYEDGFRLVIDPKSLLFLFGLNMDYSDALVGGGFQFLNPNAVDSCGCGKSFGV